MLHASCSLVVRGSHLPRDLYPNFVVSGQLPPRPLADPSGYKESHLIHLPRFLLEEGEQISVKDIHGPLGLPGINHARDVDLART